MHWLEEMLNQAGFAGARKRSARFSTGTQMQNAGTYVEKDDKGSQRSVTHHPLPGQLRGLHILQAFQLQLVEDSGSLQFHLNHMLSCDSQEDPVWLWVPFTFYLAHQHWLAQVHCQTRHSTDQHMQQAFSPAGPRSLQFPQYWASLIQLQR